MCLEYQELLGRAVKSLELSQEGSGQIGMKL